MEQKQNKQLPIKTNVRAGCGEDETPPPSDNGGGEVAKTIIDKSHLTVVRPLIRR